jgi:hypothetical protein
VFMRSVNVILELKYSLLTSGLVISHSVCRNLTQWSGTEVADHSGHAVKSLYGLRLLEHGGRGFESVLTYGCLFSYLCCVVLCR